MSHSTIFWAQDLLTSRVGICFLFLGARHRTSTRDTFGQRAWWCDPITSTLIPTLSPFPPSLYCVSFYKENLGLGGWTWGRESEDSRDFCLERQGGSFLFLRNGVWWDKRERKRTQQLSSWSLHWALLGARQWTVALTLIDTQLLVYTLALSEGKAKVLGRKEIAFPMFRESWIFECLCSLIRIIIWEI